MARGQVAFIVATPTVPKFSVVDPKIWSILHQANTPPKGIASGIGCSALTEFAPAGAMEGKGVTVLHEEKLEANQIVVLTANSSREMADYLMARRFKVYKEAIPWFQKYLDQGWVFTAIKSLPTETGETSRSTGEVLLSFKTDRPFHPYYVPKANQAPKDGQGLQAFFVSDEAFPQHADLPGKNDPVYRLSPENRIAVADSLKIPMTDLPANLVTAVYRDSEFPRVGPAKARPSAPAAWEDDLFFPVATDEDRQKVLPSVEEQAETQKRLVIIATWAPFVVLAAILFFIGRGVLRFARRRKKAL